MQGLLNLNFERFWSMSSDLQTMESIQRDDNGNFNNDNNTYLPARTTTLGYEKTEL